MSLRETMNNNPAASTGAVVGLLVIALSVIWFTQCRGGSSRTFAMTYYDTSTGQILLVENSRDNYPASPLADNANAFRCTILSCTECGEITEGMTIEDLKSNGMYIGYLTRDSTQSGAGDMPREFGGMEIEISEAENLDWLSMATHAATFTQLQEAAYKCGGDVRAIPCNAQ